MEHDELCDDVVCNSLSIPKSGNIGLTHEMSTDPSLS